MKRYSIMGRQYQADNEVEICQCDNNPEALVAAAQGKTLLIDSGMHGRKIRQQKYEHVYFVDNEAKQTA